MLGKKRSLMFFLVVLLLSLLALMKVGWASGPLSADGAWAQYKFDPPHTGLNPFESVLDPDTVPSLRLGWSYSFPCSTYSPPTVVAGLVYAGSYCGDFHALDATTGLQIWSAQLGGVINGTALGNGVVYVSVKEAQSVRAFDATSGAPLWTAHLGGITVTPPTVVDGVVYESALDGKLYAFDAATGAALWTAAAGDGMASAPAVDGGVAYVGARDRKLHAYDLATGVELWAGATGDWVDSDPAVADGVVYVGSRDGSLYAFDATGCGASDCSPLWTALGAGGIPAVADGVVYIGSNTQAKFFAFDAAGCDAPPCDPLWSTNALRGPPRSAPSVANGVVYAVDRTGLIHAFDAATGATLWSYDTGYVDYESGGGWVAVTDGVLYVAVVFAFKLYTFNIGN